MSNSKRKVRYFAIVGIAGTTETGHTDMLHKNLGAGFMLMLLGGRNVF